MNFQQLPQHGICTFHSPPGIRVGARSTKSTSWIGVVEFAGAILFGDKIHRFFLYWRRFIEYCLHAFGHVV